MLAIKKNPGFLMLACFFVVYWVACYHSLLHFHFSCWAVQMGPVILLLMIPLGMTFKPPLVLKALI